MTNERPSYLKSGELARLIPTYPEKCKEQRTTSIFLAALMAVPPFGKRVLETIGVKCSKTTRIEAYTEVTFVRPSSKTTFRPDGLLIVRSGKTEWRALIEAKSGSADLSSEQLQEYLDIAKEFEIDALITVSNQLAVLPNHHPLLGQVRCPRNVSLFHWSWTYALTEATLLVAADDFEDPEQRYILSEVARYLKHPTSGVVRFDRMNKEWKDLVTAIQNRVPLHTNSSIIQNSVGSWHQEQRDLCLLMSRRIGHAVDLRISRKHSTDIDLRFQSDCKTLSSEHTLEFSLDIPNAASPLIITADAARRNISCSMTLTAPRDKKTTKARTNWLLRQLRSVKADSVFIRAHWSGRSRASQLSLKDLVENSDGFGNGPNDKPVKAFEILMTKDLGADFGRTTKFISWLESFVPEFYQQIGQNLRAWKPSPPPIKENEPTIRSSPDAVTTRPQNPTETNAARLLAPSLSASAAMSEERENVELPDFLRRTPNTSPQ